MPTVELDLISNRLNAVNWFCKTHGWIASVDASWLRNWLGKDGDPQDLIKEAIKNHQIDLVTERLTRGNNQAVQTPDLFAASF